MHDAARYGCFPRLTFSPYLNAYVSAFLGKPTWSPSTKTAPPASSASVMLFPPSSRTYTLQVSALDLSSASKLVLFRFIPGWVLPARTLRIMLCQVSTSVRTS